MFKKHIIFAPPLSNASFSTKSLLPTSTVCSDWPTHPVHCDWPNITSHIGTLTTLSKSSFKFYHQFKPERRTESRDKHSNEARVCVCTKAAVVWPCLPLSHTYTLEGNTRVDFQTSPVPLPRKKNSRPNPTKKQGENPGRITPIPMCFIFFGPESVSSQITECPH